MTATKMKEVDVVVVGSGVVGSIMSMELANAGLSVVCLERGRMIDPQTDFAKPYVHDELKYDRHSDIFQNLSRETITFRNTASRDRAADARTGFLQAGRDGRRHRGPLGRQRTALSPARLRDSNARSGNATVTRCSPGTATSRTGA